MVFANTTALEAVSVHGTNPQNLIEKIMRMRIYACMFWKENCFGLTAETLVDQAMNLTYVGGSYGGNQKPCPFICLILKMLQIQPDKEIIIEFIKNEDYKYVRVLGAFYLRMVGRAHDVYQYLEPLYNDYRKIRVRKVIGWEMVHVDEIIESLLDDELVYDVTMPRLPKRIELENMEILQARVSALDDDLDSDGEEAAASTADAMVVSSSAGPATIEEKNEAEKEMKEEKEEKKWEKKEETNEDKKEKHADKEEGETMEQPVDRDSRRVRDSSRDRNGRSRDGDRGKDNDRDRRGRGRDRGRGSRRKRGRSYSRSYSGSGSRSRSRSRSDSRSRSRSRGRDRGRKRSSHKRSRSDSRDRRRGRSRSRSYSRSRSDSRSRSHRRSRSRSKSTVDKPVPAPQADAVEETKNEKKKEKKSKKEKKDKKKKKKKGGFKFKNDPKEEGETTAADAKDEVAYWNAERAKLGLKPLRV